MRSPRKTFKNRAERAFKHCDNPARNKRGRFNACGKFSPDPDRFNNVPGTYRVYRRHSLRTSVCTVIKYFPSKKQKAQPNARRMRNFSLSNGKPRSSENRARRRRPEFYPDARRKRECVRTNRLGNNRRNNTFSSSASCRVKDLLMMND